MGTRAFALALIAAFAAVGCGITVIVPNETQGAGGDGATSGSTTTGPGGSPGEGGSVTTSTSTKPQPDNCTVSCSMPPANQACTCSHACASIFPPAGKVSCAPIVDLQGNYKIECVCTVGEEFSGVCFEKNEANLCDFEHGCCGKYFSGK